MKKIWLFIAALMLISIGYYLLSFKNPKFTVVSESPSTIENVESSFGIKKYDEYYSVKKTGVACFMFQNSIISKKKLTGYLLYTESVHNNTFIDEEIRITNKELPVYMKHYVFDKEEDISLNGIMIEINQGVYEYYYLVLYEFIYNDYFYAGKIVFNNTTLLEDYNVTDHKDIFIDFLKSRFVFLSQ